MAVEEEVKEQEGTKKIELEQQGQEEEGKKEETVDEKLARYEVEREEYAKEREGWEKREKDLLNAKAQDGRRNKATEERLSTLDKQLGNLQSQISGAGNQADLKRRIEGTDLNDPDAMLNLITDVSTQIADQRINSTITRESDQQKQYEGEYERAIDELGRDLDPEVYEAVRKNLEGMRGGEFCHTGIGEKDAVTNFQRARADYYEGQMKEAKKPLNLKKDDTKGGGVGGKGTSDTGKAKPVKVDAETAKLAASLGRDDAWMREHGVGAT